MAPEFTCEPDRAVPDPAVLRLRFRAARTGAPPRLRGIHRSARRTRSAWLDAVLLGVTANGPPLSIAIVHPESAPSTPAWRC